MLIVQPDVAFGEIVCKELMNGFPAKRVWDRFDVAVAWLNMAGSVRVKNSLCGFLSMGGCVRATVGLDFGHTTYEALQSFLELEEGADIITNVFFDENLACTFHPKLFLFSNSECARLIVGSNNMTGAGLATNIEVALDHEGPITDGIFKAAQRALNSWRDEREENRTRRLTRRLLEELRNRGYVLTEHEVRSNRRVDHEASVVGRVPLFGRSLTPIRWSAGSDSADVRKARKSSDAGSDEVLLMRVRPRRNGSQIQISMKVLRGEFMNNVAEVFSSEGDRRQVGFNIARGVQNTARFEAPELKGIKVPVVRFQWVPGEHIGANMSRILQFEVFDAEVDSLGREILNRLEAGVGSPPSTSIEALRRGETVLSNVGIEKAQWYKLDRF